MCTPTLLFGAVSPASVGLFGSGGAFALGPTLTTLGAFSGVAGQVFQGQAATAQARAGAQAANYQAAIARRNQEIANRAAEDAIARGKAATGRKALQTRQFIARQRVAQAGLGQTVDVGSALDLTADTAAFGKLDELTIRSNAEREALGFRTQGLNFGASAELADLRAQNALLAGRAGVTAAGFGLVGTLAGAARKVGFPTKKKTTKSVEFFSGPDIKF